MSVWSGVLDSCPGLLCCVVNLKGKLLYASHGYKAVALRLFGHKCDEGRNYPPMITELDQALHEAMTAACLGDSDTVEINEHGKIWELTASPLRIDSKTISGVVMRIMPAEVQPSHSPNMPPIIRSNPEILNSVPFRAGVVDTHGVFMAVNKFLASSSNLNLVGMNILELVDPEVSSEVLNIIMRRSGSAECRMFELNEQDNFFPFSDDPEASLTQSESEREFRHIRLHSSSVEWNGKQAVMITFEDITESHRAQEQLRRLLTFDTAAGILNRRGMEHMILHDMREAITTAGHLSLIVLSIDNFRTLTDSVGYVRGTRIIRDFVRTIKRLLSVNKKHTPGRWSIDEFMILAHCSGAAGVVMANEIRTKSDGIILSAGVADFSGGSYMSVSEFIGAAYDAMSEARTSGGNKTILARNS